MQQDNLTLVQDTIFSSNSVFILFCSHLFCKNPNPRCDKNQYLGQQLKILPTHDSFTAENTIKTHLLQNEYRIWNNNENASNQLNFKSLRTLL